MLRSVGAVLCGVLVSFLIVIPATLVAVKAMGLKTGHPMPGYLVLNAIVNVTGAFAGGWVTGKIGRPRSLGCGVALGMTMAVLGVLSYRHYTGLQPLWYQALLVAVPAICAVLGAYSAREESFARGGAKLW